MKKTNTPQEPGLCSRSPRAGFLRGFRVRKGVFTVLVLGCAMTAMAAGNDREHSASSVEQRQKTELKKYYYGNGKTGDAPKTPMAIEFYNQAVQFYEKGEYELAREALDESLQLEARNPLAWELLGEIENLGQNFDKAGECYRKSYLMSPSPRVKAKLEKLTKEQAVEGRLDTYDEEHFIIKYRRDDPKYEGYTLQGILRDSYRAVSQDLGFYINNKIVVLFYGGDEFRSITNQPHFVGGLYDGKIRLPAYQKGINDLTLRVAVRHEMTHAFVSYLSSLRAPAWIQEGLAEYEGSKVRPVDLAMLRIAAKANKLIPVDRFLIQDINTQKNPEELMIFYQQAFNFTAFLVERFGMYRIKEILQEFRKGSDSFAAIEQVLSVSPKRLESEWLETLT